ncbi:hypothetical protein ABEB36_001112 [Hypothenemus hampei]|uniref:valine--tRNA ligase n=1 Tax=Hypothenemus hampei TaxID=57062 RepID=A0ABD1FE50_HYPHA
MYRLQRGCKLCNNNFEYFKNIRSRKRVFCTQKFHEVSELAAAYKPHEVENSLNQEIYFQPNKPLDESKTFSLILPPPNVTGTLHLGHVLTACVQDIMVKWGQMQGKQTVWVPGLDHAGIATQVVVEKKIFKELGMTRHQLGRDKFEKEVLNWKEEKSHQIIQQLRRLNLSLNWEKQVFTMDKKRSYAVTEAFIRLFDQGLIYRTDHLINWSCALQSAVSDIEVDYLEVDGPTNVLVPGYEVPVQFGILTKFAYKLEGKSSDSEIIVATTRPETIFGDVAVAVNPNDSRYKEYIGKHLKHPFRNDVIPVIADDLVDPEFGTGAVKVTPAHDPVDFQAAKRHNLGIQPIIDGQGNLTNECGLFKGRKRFDARKDVINQLAEKQLLRGQEHHKMQIPICSRSKDIIEYLVKPQWFVKCDQMAAKAVDDVRNGRLDIVPKHFEKNWFQWLENTRDWCISRQLWWGHRIPAYLCRNSSAKEVWVAAKSTEEAQIKAAKILQCPTEDVRCVQDEDVLDTWFSSALQPFSVFNWPQNTDDFKNFYPIEVLVTGHDILLFWVARMVMLGTQLTGQLPFKQILLHGIIYDAHGRKMSKSLGNVIAPEEVIDGRTLEKLNETLQLNYRNGLLTLDELKRATEGQKRMFPHGIHRCGSDALRFTLLSQNIKNHTVNFDVSECHTNQLFGNKIWQATKFALSWTKQVADAHVENNFSKSVLRAQLSLMDRWILSRLTFMLNTVKQSMESSDYHQATWALKNFLYYEFCDIYLEAIKTNLKEKKQEIEAKAHCQTLLQCLDCSLRALAPFMPALSQHLHKRLPNLWNVATKRDYPEVIMDFVDYQLESEVEETMEIIVGIRRLKKLFNITFKHKPEVFLAASNVASATKFSPLIKDLAHLYELHMIKNSEPPQGLVEDQVGSNKIYLRVPRELYKNLLIEVEKFEEKKEKLLKELRKLKDIVDSEPQKKSTENDLKKIAQISEKISRIDYIKSLI